MKFIQNFIWELLTDPFAYALIVFIVLFYFKLYGVAAFSMISILFFGELVKAYLNKRKK